MKNLITLFSILTFTAATAQTTMPAAKPAVLPADSFDGKATVVKDARLDILAKKQAEFNAKTALGPRNAKGYRLMVVNSNNRDLAMAVRSKLLQNFPEQKVYMTFQAPFIKIKFGNFLEKGDAEKYKKMIAAQKIVTGNVYLVPEIIEVRPDKEEEEKEK